MPMHSKDLVQRCFEDVFNQRNFAVCDEIFAERYFERASAPFEQAEPGEVAGPAHIRGVVEWLYAQFPDLHMEIECLIAEDNMVAVRVLATGTNLGRLGGVAPPTGKSFAARQSHWFRVEDQKLAEHWVTRDDLMTMLQLGVIRRPGPRHA